MHDDLILLCSLEEFLACLLKTNTRSVKCVYEIENIKTQNTDFLNYNIWYLTSAFSFNNLSLKGSKHIIFIRSIFILHEIYIYIVMRFLVGFCVVFCFFLMENYAVTFFKRSHRVSWSLNFLIWRFSKDLKCYENTDKPFLICCHIQ